MSRIVNIGAAQLGKASLQTTPIGKLTITNVRDRISTGTFAASGGPAPVVGDVVRK